MKLNELASAIKKTIADLDGNDTDTHEEIRTNVPNIMVQLKKVADWVQGGDVVFDDNTKLYISMNNARVVLQKLVSLKSNTRTDSIKNMHKSAESFKSEVRTLFGKV